MKGVFRSYGEAKGSWLAIVGWIGGILYFLFAAPDSKMVLTCIASLLTTGVFTSVLNPEFIAALSRLFTPPKPSA